MTPSSPALLRMIAGLCSDDLRDEVLAPALADLAYERSIQPMTSWDLLVGYWRIVLAVATALPGDLLIHRRPSPATLLRTVVAIAFPGLTPSFGTTHLWQRSQTTACGEDRQAGRRFRRGIH
jgi:hypothetical protein